MQRLIWTSGCCISKSNRWFHLAVLQRAVFSRLYSGSSDNQLIYELTTSQTSSHVVDIIHAHQEALSVNSMAVALARMGNHGILPDHLPTIQSLIDFISQRLPHQLDGKRALLSLVTGVCKLIRQAHVPEIRQELRYLWREQLEPLVFRHAIDGKFTCGDISTLVYSLAIAAERSPRLMSVFEHVYNESHEEFTTNEAVKLISGFAHLGWNSEQCFYTTAKKLRDGYTCMDVTSLSAILYSFVLGRIWKTDIDLYRIVLDTLATTISQGRQIEPPLEVARQIYFSVRALQTIAPPGSTDIGEQDWIRWKGFLGYIRRTARKAALTDLQRDKQWTLWAHSISLADEFGDVEAMLRKATDRCYVPHMFIREAALLSDLAFPVQCASIEVLGNQHFLFDSTLVKERTAGSSTERGPTASQRLFKDNISWCKQVLDNAPVEASVNVESFLRPPEQPAVAEWDEPMEVLPSVLLRLELFEQCTQWRVFTVPFYEWNPRFSSQADRVSFLRDTMLPAITGATTAFNIADNASNSMH
eukprot:gb/GECG01001604.1/.p1 GENE.gb/GECG01001604.1/~~gb/GECG01001604.1/.p1  ORF type:complete len:530 (+),score=44.41 gb/GECG01001604.1/:1-1590(+)